MMIAPLDKCANRRRCRIENRHLVLFDQSPKAALVRLIWRTFIQENRGARRERTINDVTMTGYPAAVGSTPINIVEPVIEDPLKRLFHIKVVAGRRVLDAFGFTSRATR